MSEQFYHNGQRYHRNNKRGETIYYFCTNLRLQGSDERLMIRGATVTERKQRTCKQGSRTSITIDVAKFIYWVSETGCM